MRALFFIHAVPTANHLDAQKVKISNLQQMARTVAYVQEHGYDSRENLSETADSTQYAGYSFSFTAYTAAYHFLVQ